MTTSFRSGAIHGLSNPRRTAASLPAWLGTHALVASLIVLFCSASVRLFMSARADPDELVILYSDAPNYLVPAHSLLEQRAFLDNRGEPMFHRTPGYPVFLAGIMLVSGPRLRTVLVIQTVILSFEPLIIYWLARRTLPLAMAFPSGLLAAISPWGAVLAGVPMTEGLFLFLITAVFLLIKITVDSNGSKALWGAACVGCLTGGAVLVRPIWPLIVAIPIALAFWAGLRRQGVWLLVAVSLACAVVPVALWRERNQKVAHYNGLSDVSGQDAWEYLGARVRAEVSGQDRYAVSAQASQEESTWGLPFWTQEFDNERARRANAIFREFPIRTGYSFVRSAFEHMIHPSTDVFQAARLNFHGDVVVLAVWWGGLLFASAYFFWQPFSRPGWGDDQIDWRGLTIILVICAGLTLASGIVFGSGSRMRAPLEAIVPMLASAGLVRIARGFCGSDSARN